MGWIQDTKARLLAEQQQALQNVIDEKSRAQIEAMARDAKAYKEDLSRQASEAVSQAAGNTASALEAKNQYNMKATLLENAMTNMALPKADAAPAPKSNSKILIILGLVGAGFFYLKGKLK